MNSTTLSSLSSAHREIFWNLDSPLNRSLMYFFFALCLLICGYGLFQRIRLYSAGPKDSEIWKASLSKKLINLYFWAITQKGVNRDPKPAFFHSLIYLGFLALLLTTTVVAIDYDFNFPIYNGYFYIALTILSDILGLGFLLGILLAYHRRVIIKPDHLHSGKGDYFMLALLALMLIQGFFLEALRIHATGDPWAIYSPIGYAISYLFWGLSIPVANTLHFLIWWFHTLTVFTFIALLPYTKFLHILSSSLNLFFRDVGRPKGAMKYPGNIEEIIESALERGEEEFQIGVKSFKDLGFKTRLDFDACTACGRCQDVCPAYNSGKLLSPKWLMLDSRDHMLGLQSSQQKSSKTNPLKYLDGLLLDKMLLSANRNVLRADNELVQNSAVIDLGKSEDAKLAGEVLNEDVFWSCTTCGACMEVCPVGIRHVDYIADVRRSMALMEGNIPSEAQQSLRAIETRGNPYGPAEERSSWTEGISVPILEAGDSVDILYWVGCISAFDKRKSKIARALATILNASELSWGILGNRECCSGDPARRLGEENLFQSLAKSNIETIGSITCKNIVANCPHCFNSIKNEYAQLNSKFAESDIRVIHHSQLIKELIDNKQISLKKGYDKQITFHDPCYLGRYNNEYSAPRDVLVQIGEKPLQEMQNSKEKSMCCGAGGGHFWMDMKQGERVNVLRIKQAADTNADTVATACPFCLQMLEDGVKLTESAESQDIKDIAELVAQNLE